MNEIQVSLMLLGWTLMLCAVAVAVWTDVRTRRVPNVLTGSLAAVAVALHAADGLGAVAATLGVMAAMFALGTVAFSLGWFGGGDVKLLAACCGIAGLPGSITLVLFTLVAGGIVAIIEAARQRRLGAVLRSTLGAAMTNIPTEQLGVPYAVAIAIGAGAYVLSATVAPFMRLSL